MSSATVLSLVVAAISALQTILTMLSGKWFDKVWERFLAAHIQEDKKEDELGMFQFFTDPAEGRMRSDVVVRLMRLAGGVVSALTTFLALVVAGGASVVAALAADHDGIAWVAVVLTFASLVAFFGLLLLAVQRPVYDYRVGGVQTEGWRGFLSRRHPTTLTFHRDLALVLSCMIILLGTILTL